MAILATLIVMAAIVTLSAIFAYDHAPRPTAGRSAQPMRTAQPAQPAMSTPSPVPMASPPQAPPADSLAVDFASLQARLNAKVGVVVSAVGNGQTPTILGDWPQGPAWSTIKVPLVIAAYRQQNPHQITETMRAAITQSDTAAAETLWGQLGEPSTAAQKVQQVLQESGDPTAVEYRKVRPEFTSFGQTSWLLTNQVRFIAGAFCNRQNDPVFALMGQVISSQSWGLGTIPDTQFKGGWGPYPNGKYLVRQMGILTTSAGKIAAAIALEPASGQFADGTKDLSEVATWLSQHFAALPAGKCGG